MGFRDFTVREQLDVLERVSEIATLAGIRGQVDEEKRRFEAGFDLGENRGQTVYVRPLNYEFSESAVVTFFSPCVVMKRGMLKGLSKEMALELLKKNEQIPFVRFGIWSVEDADIVVVSVDHLLASLDAEEFHSHMWHVALIADGYEEKHGADVF